ncbi:MAG: ATP-binding protein [Coriobacteriia bacterium]|nr:ATP-binding protein [Coriobacteriia bacterium]
MRVGVYQNEPKVFTVTEENGRPAGIFIDLIEQMAKEEGWTLVYVSGSWEEGLAELESGRIDLMPDVAYSEARDKVYDFHKTPVVDSWSYVYARPGVEVDRLSQLNGKSVAVLKGSIQETVFTQMVKGFGYDVTIVPLGSLKEAFARTQDGVVDAAIANYLFGDYFFQEYGLRKTPIVFNAVPLFYATAQGRNADLLEAADRHLTTWINEPGSVYYRTLSRYTAEVPESPLPTWVYWTIGAIAGLLLIATGLALLLRWQVGVKTQHLVAATEAVREAEERLRLALDASGQGIWDWYPKTGEVIWTPRNFVMLGYEPDAFPMSMDVWKESVHPDDLQRTLDVIEGVIETGDRTFDVEYRLRRKSGEWMWTASNGKAVQRDNEDRPERVVGTNADITARRTSELELERYRGHLEELVDARTRELADANTELDATNEALQSANDELESALESLTEANEELGEATAAKSRFLANMSHELRTPLNSIIGFAGVLAGGMTGALTEEQSMQVGMIYRSGKQLLELINDVLDLSRVEAGGVEVRRGPVDPAAVIEDVEHTVRPLAAEKGIAIQVHAPRRRTFIDTDADKLRQILINIVGNAVKFTSDGSVSVTFEYEPDGWITFVVSDTGRGIPEDEVSKVFDVFHQADHPGEIQPQGSGLGLTISRDLARLLGGDITVTSTLGTGSVFTLTLPA